jgi:iron complex transport system substrate-binding protein
LSVADVDVPVIEDSQRVLALAVGSGELVDLLGAGNQLVGKDETSSTIQEVPTVTQAHQIDIEQAVSLRPTVVLVDELTGPPEAVDALAASGAQIIDVPSVWTLDDVESRVSVIADAIGAPAESARELSAALTRKSEVSNPASPRVAFLYLRGPSAIYLLGGANTGADALIEAAGGIDVGAELGYDGFVPLTAEAIVEADPDVLLVMKDGLDSVGGIDGLLALPGVAQTRAGVDRKVVVVDDQVLLSFGARTPALIDRLTEVFTEGSA